MFWFEFLICASLLTFFAYHLCKEGMILSEKTHLEEGVIGMFFLAVATSFPEIVTSATAVHSLGRIGLGYGDLLGSVTVNFMILAALDIYSGKGRILRKIDSLNGMTGDFVLCSAFLILLCILLRVGGVALPDIKGVGVESVLIAAVYFTYLGVIHKKGTGEHESVYKTDTPFWSIWAKFIALLVVVMFLGMWMARIGDKIVVNTTLSQTFTGTLFLGFATSLPEIIVSFAALRAGSPNMAVGNVLGSNLFDLSVVPLLDVLTRVPILGALSSGQVIATGIALVLAVLAIAGMKAKRDSNRRISWDTGLIFAVGLAGFVLIYFIK